MSRWLCLAILLMFTLSSRPVSAQGGGAPAAAPAKPVAPVLKVTADLGFVSTSGNSEVQTLTVGDKVTFKIDKILLTQTFNVVHGSSDGKTSTSNWRGLLRGDYQLPSVFGAYLSVSYDRNTFAGLLSRVVTSSGLTAHVIRKDRQHLSVEAGLSLTAQRQANTPTPSIDALGGRTAFVFSQKIGEKASLQQSAEMLPNFKDRKNLRVNMQSTILAPVTKVVGLKLSYDIRFDGAPAKNKKKTDRIFSSGISVSF